MSHARRATRIVMTMLVRDEEDILESNIRFHLAQGVSHVIVMDHLSQDGSRDIIDRYCREGVATLWVQQDPGYRQAEWVTMMARSAATAHGADWVINSDADEFWWPIGGDLRTVLAAVPEDIGTVHVNRYNFPPVGSEDGRFSDRMTYRDTASVNTLGQPLPGKACHRGHAGAVVAMGNHAATVPGLQRMANLQSIEILHFPARSKRQFIHKIAIGGTALAQSPDVTGGDTWKALAAQQDGASQHYAGVFLEDAALPAMLETGRLVRDTRLRDYLHAHRIAWGLQGDSRGV